jgi:hypothetical protein
MFNSVATQVSFNTSKVFAFLHWQRLKKLGYLSKWLEKVDTEARQQFNTPIFT